MTPTGSDAASASDANSRDPIRVLVADCHALNRAGLRCLLAKLPTVEVVAEAAEGQELPRLVQAHRPVVLLAGVGMAAPGNLTFLRRVANKHAGTRIVILCPQETNGYITAALRAGVVGCLPRRAGAAELEAALTTVSRGASYLSPAFQRLARQAGGRPLRTEADSLVRLTRRQREILQYIAEGSTTKETAFALKLSPKTVETHRAQLMERLQIFDVPGLVRFAIRHGLVAA